jgi:hypothetical protein
MGDSVTVAVMTRTAAAAIAAAATKATTIGQGPKLDQRGSPVAVSCRW